MGLYTPTPFLVREEAISRMWRKNMDLLNWFSAWDGANPGHSVSVSDYIEPESNRLLLKAEGDDAVKVAEVMEAITRLYSPIVISDSDR